MTGNYADCLNPALVTVGNNYQIDLQATTNGSSVLTTTNKYTVPRQTTFKGSAATELVVDTQVLTSPVPGAVGTTTKVKVYSAFTGSTYSTYGTTASMTIPGLGSYDLTQYYLPPIQNPLSLAVGETYTVSYTAKTESSSPLIPAMPDVTVSYAFKFLGREQVSTPAGTFQTCKLETSTVSAGVTSVNTQWIVASGTYKGLFVKTDDGKGTIAVATRLLFNGL